jgi:hypothetical protein|tara:strand:+ start:1002 stop:1430 length:429 start_codon:yes stop_codon:yes gene_type:complete
MSETTPQKQKPSARLLRVGVDDEAPEGYPEGVSRTPGSPTKQGGRTMWTKADDDDDGTGTSGTRGNSSEGEPVIKQVTTSDGLVAPVYGTGNHPSSFKRKGAGVDGRVGVSQTGGGGGGLFGMLCCIPSRKEENRSNEVRAV